ncbi:MAG TPA: glycosyltransferase family 39 protein [Solirubrobacteraceae bacterium]|nr:glycosyltransferase family 39 protein [Solirubrobacteraceae bacterium]
MATYASRPAWELRARSVIDARIAVPLGLGLLVAVSLLLRSPKLDIGFWIDEGLSVGIADRGIADIPGTLRLDGSPPLYYMLLHFWLGLAGRGEEATRALSLLLALIAIPVAWWGARMLFGERAGWIAAVLAALNPFLTHYAQEARMYALVIVLGLVACVSFVRAFAGEDPRPARRWIASLALSVAALLYTHNWGLFFGAACAAGCVALVVLAPPELRPHRRRDAIIAFGAVAALYAPWLPSLLFQAVHTGAPWGQRPSLDALSTVPEHLLGTTAGVVLLLAGGSGIVTIGQARQGRRLGPEARAVTALAIVALLTILLAFAASQASPAWANRYLAIALPPLLLLAAAGLAAARGIGLAGLALVAVIWAGDPPLADKSNVRDVAEAITPSLAPGDIVVSTQPEQVPVLSYYLPPGLRYATLTGPVKDTGVTDWRNGVERLGRASPEMDLRPMLDALEPGRRLVLISPTIYSVRRWSAPWTELVRLRSEQWNQFVSNDHRFRVIAIEPPSPFPRRRNPVNATVLIKEASG